MDTNLMISIIAAVADNNVIGHQGKVPWRLTSDLRRFAKITKGCNQDVQPMVIMGRKTFESLPEDFRPLPQRTNIILTGNSLYQANGCFVAHSFGEVIIWAEHYTQVTGQKEIFIAGGAQIYQLALPLAQNLYLTRVHLSSVGDTYFPQWDVDQWRLIDSENHPANPEQGDECCFTFEVWKRKED